jgi:hypothetical protein
MEDKMEEILHANNHKEKIIQHIRILGYNQRIKAKNSQSGGRS